jgi:hypothetical protein
MQEKELLDEMKIITRKEALAQGLKRYFTGKPCKWGHVAERNTDSDCITCRKAYQKAYDQTEKRKAAKKAYTQSGAGKAYMKAYAQSEAGKAVREAYAQSEERKAAKKTYRQSEKGKATSKAYQQSEKHKAHMKVYQHSEEGTATSLRRQLGFDPPAEYVEAIHTGRLIKRELIKLKEQNL